MSPDPNRLCLKDIQNESARECVVCQASLKPCEPPPVCLTCLQHARPPRWVLCVRPALRRAGRRTPC